MAAQTQPGGRGYFADAGDDEDEGGLLEYWRVLRRRKGTLILLSAVGLVLGVVITLPQTPVYQARTTLEVLEMNQNFMNMQNVQQVTETGGWDSTINIQTQIKILQSDALLGRVVEALRPKKPFAYASGLEHEAGTGSASWPRTDVRGNARTSDELGNAGKAGNGRTSDELGNAGKAGNGRTSDEMGSAGNGRSSDGQGNGGQERLGRDAGAAGSRVSVWRRALNLPEAKALSPEEEALAMAADTVKARVSGQTRIIEVTVDSTDPKVAAEFANRLSQEFIEQNVEARYKMTQRTGEFLSKQLDDMRVKLERSEDALQQYARRNGLVFTGGEEKGGKTNVSEEKLSQLQQELTKAQSDRVAKQSRWEMASNAPADTLPDVLSDGSLREYQTKIAELRRQEAELAETYADDNARVKRVRAQIASMEKSLTRQRGDILRRIKNEYDEAARREKLLAADFQRQTGTVTEQSEKAVQYNILKREAETNRAMYEGMLQRMKEASIASAMRASNIRVVDPAQTPKAPYKPRLTLNALLGLLGGGVFAVAFILTTEKADRTLQDPSDVAFYLNLPELGTIPSEDMGRKKGLYAWRQRPELPDGQAEGETRRMEVVVAQRKSSMLAESFRATLTSVLFAQQAAGDERRPLVVTSANPAEGKTTVACNLAIAMAETGRRVLLMDGDTRRPRVHEIFEVPNEVGFTTFLKGGNGNGPGGDPNEGGPTPRIDDRGNVGNGNGRLKGLVHETRVPGLFVMPVGPGVAGTTNLLYGRQLPELLAHLQEEFDQILIDTPPLLLIPDARIIGRMSGGVILVVRAGVTTRDAAVAARLRLKEDGIPVMGTVMNDWNPKMSKGGYYGNYDGYSRYYRRYYGHKIHEG
jgi:uncharacterized protein involved in exopolysaccharide biosynthesis/Mrp family chromosome partitioning ATPase